MTSFKHETLRPTRSPESTNDPKTELLESDCQLRSATPTDIDQILTWGEKTAGHEYSDHQEEYKADLLQMLNDEQFRIRMINENGIDLGWTLEQFSQFPYDFQVLEVLDHGNDNLSVDELVKIFQNPDSNLRWLSINAIELTSKARGHGLGQQAMALLLDEYRRNGVDLMTFNTDLKNEPMQKIGRNLGFTLLKILDLKSPDGKLIAGSDRILAVKLLNTQ